MKRQQSESREGSGANTLGDVLYADWESTPVSETEWIALVRSIAAGDQRALQTLYERLHRIVYTLSFRITDDRETAEKVALDLFHDVWRRALDYDPAEHSVIGWIMNQARSRASERTRFAQWLERVNQKASALAAAQDSRGGNPLQGSAALFRDVLARLGRDERNAIESAFFSQLTCSEVASRWNQPIATVKTHIRSGLAKLRKLPGNSPPESMTCTQVDHLYSYALRALPSDEALATESHVAKCADCQHELGALRRVIDSFTWWPIDILRPSMSLWSRLAQRIASEAGKGAVLPESPRWEEPEWKEVSPGIFCKLLASDTVNSIVSMLVRLSPRAEYPPHTHAGLEELHLLDGELWVDERKLLPGDYNRAEAGTSDAHVWSETGCTCALITSTRDVLH